MDNLAAELVRTDDVWHPRLAGHARSENHMGRMQDTLPTVSGDSNRPPHHVGIKRRIRDLRPDPCIELEKVDVGLDPAPHQLSRSANGPVVGERQVGELGVPVRVMKGESGIALSPVVAKPLFLVHNKDGIHQSAGDGLPT